MEHNISRMTQLTAEIEGLLYVIEKRDNSALREQLNEKYAEFRNLMDTFLATEAPAVVNEAPALETDKEDEAETAEVTPEVDAATEAIEADEEETGTTVQQEEETLEAIDNEEPEVPVVQIIEPETDNTVQQPKISTTINDILSGRPGELRVDEMLSRREARNLRKAFTLNDKFRFRRELFGNNDELFGQTLDTLQQMSSYQQAVEYLEHNMGWDVKNEDVADFLSIIKNHFGTH
ncbi:MAG: hypothetical protein ACI30O_00610 [Muribaculaceae bacterium]